MIFFRPSPSRSICRVVGGVWNSKPLVRSQASRPNRNTFVYCTFFLLLAVASAAGADVTLDDTMKASREANLACSTATAEQPATADYLSCITAKANLQALLEQYAIQQQHAKAQSTTTEISNQRKEEIHTLDEYLRTHP